MSSLSFVKYSGNGNDFVILDHPKALPSRATVERLCSRHFGVGADGVLVLSDSSVADARMQIFNADGGEAEMCANGLRCLVTYWDSIAAKKKDLYLIQTMNSVYPVVRKGKTFALEMSEIKDQNIFDLSAFTEFEKKFYVNTGVPHLVLLTDDAKKIDLKKIAPFYRYHPLFSKGVNVSLVEVVGRAQQLAYVRTYERGVEDETHSCGTGLTATALALKHWLGWQGDIKLETLGGEQIVSLSDKVLYSGEVTFCFKGEIEL
jgi:diaminopimelate epimerase